LPTSVAIDTVRTETPRHLLQHVAGQRRYESLEVLKCQSSQGLRVEAASELLHRLLRLLEVIATSHLAGVAIRSAQVIPEPGDIVIGPGEHRHGPSTSLQCGEHCEPGCTERSVEALDRGSPDEGDCARTRRREV